MTKILLVEDDKSLREIYGVRLLAEGYDIVSAGDGEEALAMAIKERPTLIISDVMMPKISGFDMLDILRSTTETKDIKVIMMTALSSEDQRARGQALGADRYLVKSQVGIEDVVRTVHDVLKDAPVLGQTPAQVFGGSAPNIRPAAPAIPPRPPVSPTPPPPMPTPSPVFAPTPPRPAPQPSNLPQPTAPFTTARPANLGERIIHPIAPAAGPTDLASRINQELQNTPTPAPSAPAQPLTPPPIQPTPPTPPPMPPSPIQPSTPIPPEPASAAPSPSGPIIPNEQESGITFEEIPRPPVPPTPPAGA